MRRKCDGSGLPVARMSLLSLALLLGLSGCRSIGVEAPEVDVSAVACIDSPNEWKRHWEERRWKCVAPTLFGTIIFPASSGEVYDSFLYPCAKGSEGNRCKKGFWYAWAFSNTNLELALELRRRYFENSTKVSSGVFSLVGFTGVESFTSSTLAYLGLYTLPANEGPLVPTWETWFRLLDELVAETSSLEFFASDKDIQRRLLEAQKRLVYAYSSLRGVELGIRHQDVVDAYDVLSGCPRKVLIAAPESNYLGLGVAPLYPAQQCTESSPLCWETFDTHCVGANYQTYKQFLVAAKLKSPYINPLSPHTVGADSKVCLIRALEYLQDHRNLISATTLRAMLAQCQDANGLNTGAGLGYNTYPNPTAYENECGGYWDPEFRPKEQTVLERLTGREFIVSNRRLKDHPEYASVQLVFGDEKERPYLIRGYCE